MTKLIAIKSLTYRTRRMMAGAEFDAKPMDARVLLAVKKAKLFVESGDGFGEAEDTPRPEAEAPKVRARGKRSPEAAPAKIVEPAIDTVDPAPVDEDEVQDKADEAIAPDDKPAENDGNQGGAQD